MRTAFLEHLVFTCCQVFSAGGGPAAAAVTNFLAGWAGAGAFWLGDGGGRAGAAGATAWAVCTGRGRREETIALVVARWLWSYLTNSVSPRIWAAAVVRMGMGVGSVSSISSVLGGEGFCVGPVWLGEGG